MPDSYEQLSGFIESTIPPFSQGTGYNLTYFDEELEAISIEDQSDYDAFMAFAENGNIPKIILTDENEDAPTFEMA